MKDCEKAMQVLGGHVGGHNIVLFRNILHKNKI